jgi:hypothetical protein
MKYNKFEKITKIQIFVQKSQNGSKIAQIRIPLLNKNPVLDHGEAGGVSSRAK